MTTEDFMKGATCICQNEQVFLWFLDDTAFKVIRMSKDDFLVIEFGPTEGGLDHKSTMMSAEKCHDYLTRVLLVDSENPALKLFFNGRI